MAIQVFNNTPGVIYVAVGITDAEANPAENGAYLPVEPNALEDWERADPGATAYVIRGNPVAQNGIPPEIHFVASNQILVVN